MTQKLGYPGEGIDEIIAKFENEATALHIIEEDYKKNPREALFQFLKKNSNRTEFTTQELRKRMQPFMSQQQLDEMEATTVDKNKHGTVGKKY